MQTFKWS